MRRFSAARRTKELKTIVIKFKKRRAGTPAPPPAGTEEARRRRRERLLGVLILAAAAVLFVLLAAALCRPFVRLLSDPGRLRGIVRRQGAGGVLLFFGVEVLQGFLPLPLELTTVAAGYVFGPSGGFFLTLASVFCSTALIYSLAKIFGERFFLLLFPHGGKTRIFRNDRLRGWVTWIVFLIPGTPKRLFILSEALVPQKFSSFLLVSTLARIPALLVCSFGGQALGSGNYGRAALLLCAVAVPALAAFLIYRAATARRKKK
mgnify:CR=1 FL=1